MKTLAERWREESQIYLSDSEKEWDLTSKMMVGDFNPYHDATNGRFTFAEGVGAMAPLKGRTENGQRLLDLYRQSHTPEKFNLADLDDAAERLWQLQDEADGLYRVGSKWYSRRTGQEVDQAYVDDLFQKMRDTKAEWQSLVDKAPDPANISDPAHRAISVYENEIRNNDYETAVVVDQKGFPVLKKTDHNKDEVSFAGVDLSRLEDGIFTHNHPGGYTFSYQDVGFAYNNGLSEMRACHKNGAYKLTRKFKLGYRTPFNYSNFRAAYKIYYDKAYDSVVKQLTDGIIPQGKGGETLNKMLDSWLKKNASKYGWEYTEEPL